MRKRFLLLLLSAAGLLGMLAFVLGLPGFMHRVMDRSLDQSRDFALAEGAPQVLTLPPAAASPENTADPSAVPLPVEEEDGRPTPAPESWISDDTGAPVPILPTLLPLITAQPASQAEGLPWLAMAPSMPWDSELSLAPTAWRSVLTAENAAALSGFQSALDRWTQLGDRQVTSRDEWQPLGLPDGRLLVENLNALSPAQQKVLLALQGNVHSDPIFIPDAATLQDIVGWPLTSMLLTAGGDVSDLMLNQGDTVPLAVFRRVLMEKGGMQDMQGEGSLLTGEEYLGFLGQMQAEAQSALEADPDGAMAHSRRLIAGLMFGDTPWSLTVLRMEPYVFEEDWEYLVSGHHVLCLDMRTGAQYTITTDMLSDRVIGIATEGTEPFLKTYAALVAQARTLLRPVDAADADAVWEVAAAKLTALSGMDFGTGLWSVSYGVGGSEHGDIWTMDAEPADADARTVDPMSGVFPIYGLVLDENLEVVSYHHVMQPVGSISERSFAADEGDALLAHVRTLFPGQPDGMLRLAEDTLEQADSLLHSQLDMMQGAGLLLTLQRLDAFTLSELVPSNGAERFFTLSLDARLADSMGHTYAAVVQATEDGQPVLRSLYRTPEQDSAALPSGIARSALVALATDANAQSTLVNMLSLLSDTRFTGTGWTLALEPSALPATGFLSLRATPSDGTGGGFVMSVREDLLLQGFGRLYTDGQAAADLMPVFAVSIEEDLVAQAEKEQPGFRALSERTMARSDTLLRHHLSRLQSLQGGMDLMETTGFVVMRYQPPGTDGTTSPIWTLGIDALVRDGAGHTYTLRVEVLNEWESRLSGLWLRP